MQAKPNNGEAHQTQNPDKTNNQNQLFGRRAEVIWFVAILLLALLVRLWGLDKGHWGAEYYTAAVRSMSMSWRNFFYCAFDPAGFISIDKPPVAFWLQVVSVKLFGFSPLAIFLPQILAGVASVAILFHLVRRRFSAQAALLAAFFFAVTPIWVAVNRTNNADSCLLLTLLFAAWSLVRATEDGSRSLLIVSLGLIGLAFNVKMFAAYIVLPVFCAVYIIGASKPLRYKFFDLLLATGVLIVISFSWVVAHELTPADARPFVGGSRTNSIMELVVGHNASNRFVSPLVSSSRADTGIQTKAGSADQAKPLYGVEAKTIPTLRVLIMRIFVLTPQGPLRLASGHLAAQTLWLFPFALAAIGLALIRYRPLRKITAREINIFFWTGWLLIYGIVYSSLGGIVHFYYLATLAPAIAALAGIGLMDLWDGYRRKDMSAWLLPAILLATAACHIFIQSDALDLRVSAFLSPPMSWLKTLHYTIVGGTLVAAVILFLLHIFNKSGWVKLALARSALAVGFVSITILPAAWTASSVLTPGNGLIPSADLYRLIAFTDQNSASLRYLLKNAGNNEKLIEYLQANHHGERFLLMTSTSELAAPVIIETGKAVLARGGFHGIDPTLTPEALKQLVQSGSIRFVMLGDVTTISRMMGSTSNGMLIDNWVRDNGLKVEPTLWQSTRHSWRQMELYDLKTAQEKLASSDQ